jgi:hypothetical protein
VAKTTVGQWCEVWLATYATRKASTVRMGKVHCDKIVAEFGDRRLDSVRPSEIRAWMVKLKQQGFADSYMFALHTRMAQVYSDAIHDGLVTRSPLSRRTSPRHGQATALRGLYGAGVGSPRRAGTPATGRGCYWPPSLACGLLKLVG